MMKRKVLRCRDKRTCWNTSGFRSIYMMTGDATQSCDMLVYETMMKYHVVCLAIIRLRMKCDYVDTLQLADIPCSCKGSSASKCETADPGHSIPIIQAMLFYYFLLISVLVLEVLTRPCVRLRALDRG